MIVGLLTSMPPRVLTLALKAIVPPGTQYAIQQHSPVREAMVHVVHGKQNSPFKPIIYIYVHEQHYKNDYIYICYRILLINKDSGKFTLSSSCHGEKGTEAMLIKLIYLSEHMTLK